MIALYDAAAAVMLAALICVTLLPRALTSQELLFSVSALHSKEIARRVLMISHMKGYSSELRRTIDLSEDPSGVLGQVASLCPKSKECRITILSSDGRKTLARWGSISSTFSESSEAILTTDSLSLIIRCEVEARSEGR